MTEGSCLCGGVRFEISEFSTDIYKCHCSRCQKRFGGASSAAALAAENDFLLISGSDLMCRFQSSAGFGSVFCKSCGSILPIHMPEQNLYWVPVGLLDSDPGIPLTRHIHVNSKAAWEILDHDAERLPEGFEL